MSAETERVDRVAVPELDRILGHKFPVLDDGFVRVVDYMGGDTSIVQAARVSYGKGTKTVHEDRGLIRYLMRHRHTTPFEMCEIKLHVRVPMDIWRQWIRHRTANVNEYSTRYSEAIASAQKTPPEKWRLQSQVNQQGSSGMVDAVTGAVLSLREGLLHRLTREVYEDRLRFGVAREQARKDLPLATYTEAYWKVDLHNLLHFLALRMDAHAQEEIRAYANVIGREVVSCWCPLAWEAFLDYWMGAETLTRLEQDVIYEMNHGRPKSAIALATSFGWLDEHGQPSSRNRERSEAEEKLGRLGIQLPWGDP